MSGSTPTASGASSVLTTKGDIVGYDTARKRIGVGSNDQVLTADSTDGNGIAWKTPSGSETHEFTSAETFTPTKQTGIVKVTVDATDLTGGNITINVDGSTDETVSSGIKTRIVNPSSSLTVQSNNVPFDLSTASYDSKSFSVTTQETQPHGFAFNSDGSKMYAVGTSSNSVYQYSLSTAWDISTASYDSVSFSVSTQSNWTEDVYFKPDGSKMYVITGLVYQYSLSTAYDVSTASYDSKSFNFSSQENSVRSFRFNSDGSKMYAVGTSNDTVYQYSLSTAYDVSTASYDSVSFSVSSQEGTTMGLEFNSDGSKMFIVGTVNDTVYQYSLSTAWDLSTASYDSESFSVSSQESSPQELIIKSDGTKMYVIGNGSDTVYQYSTATLHSGTALATVG